MARERTPNEPMGLVRVHGSGTGVEAAEPPRRSVPVTVAVLVVAVEAVWLIGIAYVVFRLVAAVV